MQDRPDPEAAKKPLLRGEVMPRGVSRVQAANYVGVSPVTFDRMVRDKMMPKPLRIYARTVWDLHAIDAAFDALDSASVEADDGWHKMAV